MALSAVVTPLAVPIILSLLGMAATLDGPVTTSNRQAARCCRFYWGAEPDIMTIRPSGVTACAECRGLPGRSSRWRSPPSWRGPTSTSFWRAAIWTGRPAAVSTASPVQSESSAPMERVRDQPGLVVLCLLSREDAECRGAGSRHLRRRLGLDEFPDRGAAFRTPPAGCAATFVHLHSGLLLGRRRVGDRPGLLRLGRP